MSHDHAVVMQCIDGSATVWIGASYAVRGGDIVLIPEGTPHFTTNDDLLDFIGVSVCGPCMREPWNEVLREVFDGIRTGGSAVLRPADGGIRATQIFEQLLLEHDDASQAGQLAADGLMTQLAAEILRARPQVADNEGTPNSLVAAAIRVIETGALNPLSLADVAQAVSRTPAHVAATMKRHTGRTVGEWITDYRMAEARQLLLRSDESIEALAERVGYASVSHFHRVFRTRHGVAPAQWRALHQT